MSAIGREIQVDIRNKQQNRPITTPPPNILLFFDRQQTAKTETIPFCLSAALHPCFFFLLFVLFGISTDQQERKAVFDLGLFYLQHAVINPSFPDTEAFPPKESAAIYLSLSLSLWFISRRLNATWDLARFNLK